MLKSQKGSTLIAVMLVFLVLTTLLLVLLAANIGGAKRTEMRETDITENLDALAAIKEGVAVTQAFITNNSPTLLTSNTTYDSKLKLFMDEENAKNSGYKLKDVTIDHTTLTDGFTRVLNVTSPPYSQLVYVTATPSFLKYALGSRSNLTMNGSPSIQGDIYSRFSLNISNEALYLNNSVLQSKSTYLPVSKHSPEVTSELFIEEGDLQLCTSGNCYSKTANAFKKTAAWRTLSREKLPIDIHTAFSDKYAPRYAQLDAPFADIDIPGTFLEKVRDVGIMLKDFPTAFYDTEEKRNAAKVAHIRDELAKEAPTYTDSKKLENPPASQYILYRGDPNINVSSLTVPEGKWLIIDGDANFEDNGQKALDIKGNILITGNLKLTGNLSFDSVIYVLGQTTIKNADIHCYQNSCTTGTIDEDIWKNPAFILMTQGNLDINLVNKFNESTSGINGYLYTASVADVYGVGSLLNVTGGLFSKDNLTINSFRGNAADGTPELTFTEKADIEFSRFKIVNNKRLFFEQEDALPKVKQLSAVPDRLEKDN